MVTIEEPNTWEQQPHSGPGVRWRIPFPIAHGSAWSSPPPPQAPSPPRVAEFLEAPKGPKKIWPNLLRGGGGGGPGGGVPPPPCGAELSKGSLKATPRTIGGAWVPLDRRGAHRHLRQDLHAPYNSSRAGSRLCLGAVGAPLQRRFAKLPPSLCKRAGHYSGYKLQLACG